jgi:hypothetical protein
MRCPQGLEARLKSSFILSAMLIWGALSCDAQGQAVKPLPLSSDSIADSTMDETGSEGSTYVPVDSWIYPALDRLHGLGYVDTAFLGLRPWTRLSIAHMLDQSADRLGTDTNNDEARSIYLAVLREVQPDRERTTALFHPHIQLESVYTNLRGISGTPLRDSFHLGQSIVNDYGRPYQEGFDNYSGFSARAVAGRFSLYFRGEGQHSPSAAGYSSALAANLSNNIDLIPFATNPRQDTIPLGPISSLTAMRVMEANLSYHLLGHEFSFGKSDQWLGPAKGASMLWSNNAENIYAFQINRVEPLRIPLLSNLTGPFRYEFFVGSLKGHTYPNDPWVHMQKVSFKPTRNLEFGFDRLTVWGGKGHAPITIHSFLHSFFSFQNVTVADKQSRCALWYLRLQLSSAVCAQLVDAVYRFSGARRCKPDQRSSALGCAPRDLFGARPRHGASGSAAGGSQHGHSEFVGFKRPVSLLRKYPAARTDEQGHAGGRLDRPPGQGRAGMDHLSPVSAGRGPVHVPARKELNPIHSRRHDPERLRSARVQAGDEGHRDTRFRAVRRLESPDL